MSTPDQSPLTTEQYQRLSVLVSRSLHSDSPPLEHEDAVALGALLDASNWWGLVKQTRFHVQANPDTRSVRFTIGGAQYGLTQVDVPFDLSPDSAEEIAQKLDEAATFARLNIKVDPDAFGEGGKS